MQQEFGAGLALRMNSGSKFSRQPVRFAAAGALLMLCAALPACSQRPDICTVLPTCGDKPNSAYPSLSKISDVDNVMTPEEQKKTREDLEKQEKSHKDEAAKDIENR
jgi:hypothetical protein